jgi:hypothetical protein
LATVFTTIFDLWIAVWIHAFPLSPVSLHWSASSLHFICFGSSANAIYSSRNPTCSSPVPPPLTGRKHRARGAISHSFTLKWDRRISQNRLFRQGSNASLCSHRFGWKRMTRFRNSCSWTQISIDWFDPYIIVK